MYREGTVLGNLERLTPIRGAWSVPYESESIISPLFSEREPSSELGKGHSSVLPS